MEIEENNNKGLIDQTNPRSKRQKKSKYNLNLKNISIYSIFAVTLVTFIILYNLYPNINYNIFTKEENDKKNLNNNCEIGYKLVDGKCVINYTFKAEYKTFKENEESELIKIQNEEAISELIINGEKVKPTSKYTFQKKGVYTVYMLLDMNKIETIEELFSGIISLSTISFSELFNIEKYTSMVGMFRNCKSLKNADLSKLNTKNIKEMDFMFSGANVLTSVDLSSFTNENLISMSRMFFRCSALESLDLSHFKTPKVEDMSYAFADCNKIKKLDLSGFETKNVKNMRGLFERCKSMTNVNIQNFNTENVIDMAYMFTKCYSLIELDMSKIKAPKVTSIVL